MKHVVQYTIGESLVIICKCLIPLTLSFKGNAIKYPIKYSRAEVNVESQLNIICITFAPFSYYKKLRFIDINYNSIYMQYTSVGSRNVSTYKTLIILL